MENLNEPELISENLIPVTKEEYVKFLHTHKDVNDTTTITEEITQNNIVSEENSINESFHIGNEVVKLEYSIEKETDNFRPDKDFNPDDIGLPKINNFEMFKFQDKFKQYKERMSHILNVECDGSPEILMKYFEEKPHVKDYIDGKRLSY